jgi:ectoine hydroxylase-related dioxygenase (phytanoyl-CoA dioxygenase family)
VTAAPARAGLRNQYERDGYVVVPGLIEPGDAAALAAEVHDILGGAVRHDVDPSQVQRQFGRGGQLRLTKISQLTRTTTSFAELAHHDAVVDVVEELVGPGARLFRDVVVGKPARTGGRFSYHQDSAYWDVEPMALVSAWVALTDAPADSGCLSVVPGSHRRLLHHGLVLRDRVEVPAWISDGLRRAVSRAGTGDNPGGAGGNVRLWKAKSWVLSTATRWLPILGDLQDFRVLARDLDARAAQAVPLRAGDAVFFHSLLVHGSGANVGDHDRQADIVSYAPADARFTGHGQADMPLARMPAAV